MLKINMRQCLLYMLMIGMVSTLNITTFHINTRCNRMCAYISVVFYHPRPVVRAASQWISQKNYFLIFQMQRTVKVRGRRIVLWQDVALSDTETGASGIVKISCELLSANIFKPVWDAVRAYQITSSCSLCWSYYRALFLPNILIISRIFLIVFGLVSGYSKTKIVWSIAIAMLKLRT